MRTPLTDTPPRFRSTALRLLALGLLLAALGCAKSTANADMAAQDAPPGPARTFSIAFPDDFTVTTAPKTLCAHSYFPVPAEGMVLGGYYSGDAYAGTNFGSASVVVSVRPPDALGEDCTDLDGSTACGPKAGVRSAVVNGIAFRYAEMNDAAVGHRLQARQYWTLHDGRRYEVLLAVSYTDIGMYTPGAVKGFDADACMARLLDILHTFTFTTP